MAAPTSEDALRHISFRLVQSVVFSLRNNNLRFTYKRGDNGSIPVEFGKQQYKQCVQNISLHMFKLFY